MASKKQIVGMRGVYLVAAELARHGFIASPTSRSARGADILVTDLECAKAFSVQVKTNASQSPWWLLNEQAKRLVSDIHVYVFVSLRENSPPEFFVVPSKIVAEKMWEEKHGQDNWYGIQRDDILPFRDNWEVFGKVK